ncbi:hypothetical protein [Microbacterium murale]|uniref:DUF4935 domain-containing protein n=1 Tax=Microbacterium murale TaxID=1081040 RepID=A0ABQ1RPC5_9MICO|nr:hypothetical protein [Microbacterium murale]GGD76920.1 hypothetical protein GCM10007269_19820 [Microbacterium murale]
MSTSNQARTERPTVYLDQWVWIRMALAAAGRPRVAADVKVLEAIREASAAGVVFPLSATHYEETLRIADPRQRRDLATIMATVSQMRTLRRQNDLVRQQLLVALHETVGRPTFRPKKTNPLGIGVSWAFRGKHAFLRALDQTGRVVSSVDPVWLRHINQYAETEMLAGPADEDLPLLAEYGYRPPRAHETAEGNRLAWEELLEERLLEHPRPSRTELRVWLLARELSHEYLDLLISLFHEYRLSLSAISPVADGVKSRQRIVSFVERVPTLRIAAELKLEIVRDSHRSWSWNMLRDIDALSIAIPYCDVVVADKDAAALVNRTKAPDRYGSAVISRLEDLLTLLPALIDTASSIAEDPTGWIQVAPGVSFTLTPPRPLTHAERTAGYVVRMLDEDGTRTTSKPEFQSDERQASD